MIAKAILLFAIVAAAHATVLLNSGLIAPGVLNRGILAPGLAGVPITYSNGLIGSGLIGSGLIGASPLALSNGIISPIGLRSAGILAAPGLVNTAILK